VNICGITQERQAREITEAGADAIGINLWPKSKRYLPLSQARGWLRALHDRICLVAVMVNPEPKLLDDIIASQAFHTLQLHGDEPPGLVHELMHRGVRVIKALQVRDRESLAAIAGYPCQDILLDAWNPGLYGGEGTVFPWELAIEARTLFPERRIILSGGLTPENVREAVRQTRPHGVDVASGVESAPGVKDLEKVRCFIAEARGGQA
jgi:phosphoribosylanthranilate isomerase